MVKSQRLIKIKIIKPASAGFFYLNNFHKDRLLQLREEKITILNLQLDFSK